MASGGEIFLIILIIVIVIIIFVLVGVFIYLWINNSNQCSPGETANGLACTNGSDCISCNCSSDFCQPDGETTGEAGSSCSANGASCNAGLVCNANGICASPQPPAPGADGASCTNNSDCASNFCSADPNQAGQSYCQNSGTDTATQGSNCSGGSTCDAGLFCQASGTTRLCLPITTPPITPVGDLNNGAQCMNDGDCKSGNCSLNTIDNTSYCQPLNKISGWEGSTCSTNGSACFNGMTCSGGTCLIDTTGVQPIAAICGGNSGNCALTFNCSVISDGSNTQTCSGINTAINTNINASNTRACPLGMTYDPTSEACFALEQQMCQVDTQCTTNNCNTNNWGIWETVYSSPYPTWSYKLNWPGKVAKMVAFNSAGTDNMMALITSGMNPGLYTYNGIGPTISMIPGVTLNSPKVCGDAANGGTISNFAISNDGSLIYIAVQGLTGTYTITPAPNDSGAQQPVTFTNVEYTGIFQITLNGQQTSCTAIPAPNFLGGFFVPPPGSTSSPPTTDQVPTYDVSQAPGILLGPVSPATLQSNPNLTDKAGVVAPITYVLDMDITYTNPIINSTGSVTPGFQAAGNLAFLAVSDTSGIQGAFYMSVPAFGFLASGPSTNFDQFALLGYPGIRISENQQTAVHFCSCNFTSNGTSVPCISGTELNPTNCGNSDRGLVNPDFPTNQCVVPGTNQDQGFCYLQSAKKLRATADIFQFPTNNIASNQTSNIDDLTFNFDNEYVTRNFFAAVLANIGSNAQSTDSLLVYNFNNAGANGYQPTPRFPQVGWIVDYDVFSTSKATVTTNNQGQQVITSSVTPAIVFANNSGSMYLYYIPNIMNTGANFNTPPVNLGAIPGYYPTTGRVAIGKTRAFFSGPGTCVSS